MCPRLLSPARPHAACSGMLSALGLHTDHTRMCSCARVLLTRGHLQYKEGKAVLEKARMKREEWTSVSEYGTTLRSRAICRMPLCLPSLAPSSPCSSGSAPSRTSDALHRAPNPRRLLLCLPVQARNRGTRISLNA